MAISTGYTISASEINALKSRVYVEAARRSVICATFGDVSDGISAKSDFINSVIDPMNIINSDRTATPHTVVGSRIDALNTNFASTLTLFEGTPFQAAESNCKNGCLGLCQGTCTDTCTGCGAGCGTSCSGCTGTCTGGCQGGCKGCDGCSGCGSCSSWACQWDGDPCAGNCSSYGCSFTGT